MVYLKRFCCCQNVKSGSLGCGIYHIVIFSLQACFCMIVMAFEGAPTYPRRYHMDLGHELFYLLAYALILCLLLVVPGCLLVYGAHKDKPNYFLPWMFWTCTECVLSFIIALSSLYLTIVLQFPIILLGVFAGLVNLSVKMYMFFCVVSHYLMLMMNPPSYMMKYSIQRNEPDGVMIIDPEREKIENYST